MTCFRKSQFRRLSAFALALLVAAVFCPRDVMATNVVNAITQSLENKNPAFISFTGRIIEISEYHGDSTRKFVTVEDSNEGLINFIASENTYLPEGTELVEGAEVTGYYDTSRPMTMIYPPQPEAVAFWSAGSESAFAKLDRFDENMVSYDGILKLNISEDTIIVMQDGAEFQTFNGETVEQALTNRALMVFYDITTRSIPAQTNPKKIVVFYETAVTQPIEIPAVTDNIIPSLPEAGTLVELVVAGEIVASIPFTQSGDGVILVPLYLVCQGMELSLEWIPDTQTALIAGEHSVTIGEDSYSANGLTISLGAAPVIIDDRTYIPLSFFSQVLGLNNAYYNEGQIVVDNFEKME